MKYKVTLNDRVYEVEVEQGEAMLVDEYAVKAPAAPVVGDAHIAPPSPVAQPVSAPAPTSALAPGEVIKSPMPGNILKINVAPGQAVNEGDVLMVLEAMKMENEIVASKGGTVKQIAVSKGQVVETGTPLAVIA